MSAPTEAEIREAIERRITRYESDNPDKDLGEAVEGFAAFLTVPVYAILESEDPLVEILESGDDPCGVWSDDLRASEAIRLDAIAKEVIPRATARARTIIVDELVAAGLAFAAEFPDAPRVRMAVPA